MANELNGWKTNDALFGTDDDDVISGHKGADALFGGHGDDFVKGGHGNDYVSGNWGNDILAGGKGADVFVFDGDFDADTIKDFSVSEGDHMEFVFYGSEYLGYTPETMLEMCTQVGRDVVLDLPNSDESVTIRHTDLSALDASSFDVFINV